MLRVSIHHARPGMELGLPVFHPSIPGHVLLRPGYVLDAAALARLQELRVRELYLRCPEMESVLSYFNPAVVREQARLARLLGSAFDKMREPLFAEIDFKAYAGSIRSLLEKLAKDTASQVLVHDVIGAERPFVMHATSTCFLSLLLGLKLETYLMDQRKQVRPDQARCVENLGIGALLCDIGMLHLPHEVVERWKQSGDESDLAYQAHVKVGYELIKGKVEPTAAATVLQHHQRYDGFGFPQARTKTLGPADPPGLSGERIHIFARIVSVADQFDRLRNPPAGEGRDEARVPNVRCLKRLLVESRKHTIDPVIFKALLSVVPAYAPGTIVRLSDGRDAIVSSFDPLNPCRPCLRTVRLVNGAPDLEQIGRGEWVDLRTQRELFVSHAEGQCVAEDNFQAWNAQEFDLRVLFPGPRAMPRVLYT